MLFALPLRVICRVFHGFVLLLGVVYTAFAYFVVFALFCAICVAFECYVHFLHNFSRLFACRLHYICTCVCHLRNEETFRLFPPLAVATRFAPQHTCERPVLSAHLGPLCLGLFNLSLQGHQLSLKPALRSEKGRG